ncbi:hypothetical protein ABMA28_009418 [Loxostege sticticalis]|uniref:HTH CENPB-type domain-containing protein n=1 Tax=Loxostege sticticalis TaxID=481309 RepID=A0ABD0SFE1_LOXSC
MEKDLVARIKKIAEIGMPLTPKVIRKQAYVFCKKYGIKHTFNTLLVWLKRFLKLNPEFSKRKAQIMNPARAQKLNRPIVEKHFASVRQLYDELDITQHPERLYNVDEKGCRARRVHLIAQEHAENVTVIACVNAIGTAIPPMVIFKGKRMRPEFYDNLPAGSLVKMAPKGSMTTELFIQFIQHLANYKSPRKCLLIFDGAASHLDYQIADEAEKFDIELYCLPSNTTHELQPLDKSLRQNFDQSVAKMYVARNYYKRLQGDRPWDPSAIPDTAYAPSLLTETCNQLQEIPGQIQNPKNHSYFSISSPSENGSDTFIYKILQHNPVRQYKIYTSSSESEEENLPRSTCDQNCPAEAATHDSDDSEDNIPLINFKKVTKAIPADVAKTPFQELIPTPNFATIKTKPGRKALNYVGQRDTKDLFKDVQVKKKVHQKNKM